MRFIKVDKQCTVNSFIPFHYLKIIIWLSASIALNIVNWCGKWGTPDTFFSGVPKPLFSLFITVFPYKGNYHHHPTSDWADKQKKKKAKSIVLIVLRNPCHQADLPRLRHMGTQVQLYTHTTLSTSTHTQVCLSHTHTSFLHTHHTHFTHTHTRTQFAHTHTARCGGYTHPHIDTATHISYSFTHIHTHYSGECVGSISRAVLSEQ